MKISNKLVILRDKSKYSQQYVADALNVSKSTYCRYEQGISTPGIDEINALLQLYNITYEDFVDINLPLIHIISYPQKLLNNLEQAITYGIPSTGEYETNQKKYNEINEALDPILAIREEAMSFPKIDISEIPSGTTVKTVKLDIRGEILIDKAIKTLDALYQAMQS